MALRAGVDEQAVLVGVYVELLDAGDLFGTYIPRGQPRVLVEQLGEDIALKLVHQHDQDVAPAGEGQQGPISFVSAAPVWEPAGLVSEACAGLAPDQAKDQGRREGDGIMLERRVFDEVRIAERASAGTRAVQTRPRASRSKPRPTRLVRCKG